MGVIAFTREHDRVVRGFAFKALRRAQGAGAKSLQFEDVYQELMLAWCAARDRWREEVGVPFLAYLQLGMQKRINRFLEGQIWHGQNTPLDMGVIDGGDSIHHLIEDEKALEPFEAFERDNHRDAVMARMTKTTRTFVNLLRDPPPFLIEAVRERRARQAFAKANGLPGLPEAAHVTAAMVFEFMGLAAAQRAHVYAELKRLERGR